MGLEAAIDGLRTAASTMADLARTYTDPPESISEFPAVIAYSRDGQMEAQSAGLDKALHTIVVEVHESRQVLPDAVDRAKRWPDRFMAALRADETLGGSVTAIVWPVTYRSGPLVYGKETHYGVQFRVTVKVMS